MAHMAPAPGFGRPATVGFGIGSVGRGGAVRSATEKTLRGLRLSRAEPLSEWPLKYVNRLSDLFFVLSRWISKKTGEQEYLWQRGLMEKPKAKK